VSDGLDLGEAADVRFTLLVLEFRELDAGPIEPLPDG
jgi:hypothetical protein